MSSVKITKSTVNVRFTGEAYSTFNTVSIKDGQLGTSGHYTAQTDEIFDVFVISCGGDNFIGLRTQVDHNDMYLIISLQNYDMHIEDHTFELVCVP